MDTTLKLEMQFDPILKVYWLDVRVMFALVQNFRDVTIDCIMEEMGEDRIKATTMCVAMFAILGSN